MVPILCGLCGLHGLRGLHSDYLGKGFEYDFYEISRSYNMKKVKISWHNGFVRKVTYEYNLNIDFIFQTYPNFKYNSTF